MVGVVFYAGCFDYRSCTNHTDRILRIYECFGISNCDELSIKKLGRCCNITGELMHFDIFLITGTLRQCKNGKEKSDRQKKQFRLF